MPKTIFDGAHSVLVEVLINARKRSGLTQAALGAKVGKDQTFISIIEGSQRRIDVLEFIALARAMGEKPEALFDELLSKAHGDIEI